ncbi:alpha/beta hydrolase [Clostridium sp. AM58-1XD]|uniref:alpha/beta hydrolase n=1 Tax=Clostridium sp. AM58-1XD TaxID=2292307 RepID=UPI000E53DAB8|nr:alpha/beta hydrolase [Clostridium sp. AM58-1XD]RGY98725.1 alpha/beta hydrolase [Clostridium sp. AM58-1XD]
MKEAAIKINGIPSIIWGEKSDKGIIAVHGNMSNKADIPIKIFAEKAVSKGYQVLSFDLPEHGDRKEEGIPCKVQYGVKDLRTIMAYAKGNWNELSLFANSLGAYFSLLAYKEEQLKKAWFLSPVVDMQRMIENMMKWFHVTEERLESEQAVPTPAGQMLYWDYYCYVKEHPVEAWKAPTSILYGSRDDMCEIDTITKFTDAFSCSLKTLPEAGHYFHTPEQLAELEVWISETM